MEETFNCITIYDVKKEEVDNFELVMKDVIAYIKSSEGIINVSFIKRNHYQDIRQLKSLLPPHKISRIYKSVKYILVEVFASKKLFCECNNVIYNLFEKTINNYLVKSKEEYLGTNLS